MQNGDTPSPHWKPAWQFLLKPNIQFGITKQPSNPTAGCLSKRNRTMYRTPVCESSQKLCSQLEKQNAVNKCPSAGEWVNKSWYIPTVKCDSEKKTEAQAIHPKDMDGSQARYTEWKEPRDRGCIKHDSVYITNCKGQTREGADRPAAAGAYGWGGLWPLWGTRDL